MKERISKIIKWSAFPSIVLLIILCIYGASTVSYFFKATYITSILKNYTPLVLISLGLSVVIIGGGIDLAIGTITALVNVMVMLMTVQLGMNIWLAMIVGIVIGLLCGFINGAIIAYARINPLISSFAFSWVTGGIALWVVPDPNIYPLAANMVQFYSKSVLGIPTCVLIVVVAFAVWMFVMKTDEGLHIYALGNDMKRAFVTGINIEKSRIVSYMFSGFCAALAGISMTGALGIGSATLGGNYTIQGIAACVIGGVALTGGLGSAFGGITGGLFIGLLTSMVVSSPIGPYYQGFVINLIILLSILAPSIVTTVKANRAKKTKGLNSIPWLRRK